MGPESPIRAPWKVADAHLVEGRVVVLGDYSAVSAPAIGLACYSAGGELLWEATGGENNSPLVAMETEPSLTVWSYDCWRSIIDVGSGKTMSRTFTK